MVGVTLASILVTFGVVLLKPQSAPPFAISANLSGGHHSVLAAFEPNTKGPAATRYIARIKSRPSLSCSVQAGPKGAFRKNKCEIKNLSNYEWVTIQVAAANSAGRSRWTDLKRTFVSDIQVESCLKVLTSWEIKLAFAFQTGQSDQVLIEMMREGLYGYGSTTVGQQAGQWILHNATVMYQASLGGPPLGLTDKDTALKCESLGALNGSMGKYNEAPR